MMTSGRWSKDQVKLAFHLYCQVPYGRIGGTNSEIIRLAQLIGRTPSATAMKMLNIASLDPAITSTGRVGLGNASAVDREVWAEFHEDWERLADECAVLRRTLSSDRDPRNLDYADEFGPMPDDFVGETRSIIAQQRIKQHFFRRAVLSSYRGRCCMSGVSEPRLLTASHIVPWSIDKANRLNPRNGLCLSAIHDRAFDKGLITLTDTFRIVVSEEIKKRDEPFLNQTLLALQGQAIELPERFAPSIEFIARHRSTVFVDNIGA